MDVKVINDVYRLMSWYGNLLQNFPRNYRYGLGLRIENTIYDILHLCNRANLSQSKVTLLEEANANVQTLRFLVRLIRELKLISDLQHHAFIKQIDEIGKQLGGWAKAQRG